MAGDRPPPYGNLGVDIALNVVNEYIIPHFCAVVKLKDATHEQDFQDLQDLQD